MHEIEDPKPRPKPRPKLCLPSPGPSPGPGPGFAAKPRPKPRPRRAQASPTPGPGPGFPPPADPSGGVWRGCESRGVACLRVVGGRCLSGGWVSVRIGDGVLRCLCFWGGRHLRSQKYNAESATTARPRINICILPPICQNPPPWNSGFSRILGIQSPSDSQYIYI